MFCFHTLKRRELLPRSKQAQNAKAGLAERSVSGIRGVVGQRGVDGWKSVRGWAERRKCTKLP